MAKPPLSRFEQLTRDALRASQNAPNRAQAILGGQTPSRASMPHPEALAEVAGRQLPGANRTEALYAAELHRRLIAGEVAEWWWQPLSLRLSYLKDGRGDYYRPDFMVQLASGHIEIHETKGFMEDDARTKLKAACALYPFAFIVIRRVRGAWELIRFQGSFP